MPTYRRIFLLAGISLAVSATLPGALAQTPQLEQARILVGFPAGGGTDASARRLAEGLTGRYAKSVIVENKPGASGRLAVDELRRGAMDGSLLLVQPEAVVTQQPLVDPKYTNFKFDDVVAVAAIGSIQHAFAVGPTVPESVKTMKDFFEWAKANPSKASFGTPGNNSAQDFLMRSVGRSVTGELTHVPYKGSAPGVQDLIAGQITAFLSPVGDTLPYTASGRVRLLGTSGEQRSKFAPNVPTFAEQGLPEMTLVEYFGVWMARGTPDAVQANASAAVRSVVSQPATAEALLKFGIEATPISQQEFASAIRASNAAWAERLRKIGFKPET